MKAASIPSALNVTGTQQNESEFMFIISNCDSSSLNLNIDYILINPNGEHLSSTDVPNKLIHTVTFITWSTFGVVFFLFYIKKG